MKRRKKLKKHNIIILFCLIILLVGIIYFMWFNPFLSIELIGKEKLEIELGDNYKDKGVKATYFGKDISNSVAKNTISTDKVGKQVIEYKVRKIFTIKSVKRIVNVKEKTASGSNNVYNQEEIINYEGSAGYKDIIIGPKYINNILIVNKKYALPANYVDGVDDVAYQALEELQAGAERDGFNIPLISGYRSYDTQAVIYQRYVNRDGQELADTYSARPGHSEHQTGLAFDVGLIDDEYGNTPEGQWLSQNCAEYGFVIRYQKGKEHITGYQYEPWHIRYVGINIAKEIMSKGITLEEYLNVV